MTALRHIIQRPGLMETVLLAAAVNLIIGVTLATSAAMFTGVHGETDTSYALLQMAGALMTVIVLFMIARLRTALWTLGILAYAMIFIGGLVSGLAGDARLYAVGFIVVVGFDKMFNVFIRSLRMRTIPREDLGKTTGLIVMLNNLSQPLAGLLVSAFAGRYGAGTVITALTLVMGVVGLLTGPSGFTGDEFGRRESTIARSGGACAMLDKSLSHRAVISVPAILRAHFHGLALPSPLATLDASSSSCCCSPAAG